VNDFQILDKSQSRLLAKHLPESPQTVISRAHLQWGTARAYAVGLTATGFETAVAGAIIDNQLVAIAHNAALTEKYGDISVFTLPNWRRHGFATATAALVAQAARERPYPCLELRRA
jgi:GNAT superfamily N-acetyltransferase